MRDARTRQIERDPAKEDLESFRVRYRAALVLLSGAGAGTEYALEAVRLTLGRGAEADLRFDDPSMSRTHAAVEFAQGGFRLRDIGSTNGVLLNGSPIQTAELKHGDRIRLGESSLQYIVEERSGGARAYVLSDD